MGLLRVNSTYILVAISILLSSCGRKKIDDFNQYTSWLNQSENGVVKSREIMGIKYTMKYLPSDYMVYKDLKGVTSITQEAIDSIRAQYDNSLTFVLNINPTDQKGGSIMSRDLKSYEEYKIRSTEMNFGLQYWLTLKTNNGDKEPVFAELENTYDLTKDRNVYIVFNENAKELLKENEKLDVVFDDQLFNTGITHYTFNKGQLMDIPELVMNTESN